MTLGRVEEEDSVQSSIVCTCRGKVASMGEGVREGTSGSVFRGSEPRARK